MAFAEDLVKIIEKINELPLLREDGNVLPTNYQQIQDIARTQELSLQAKALLALFMRENPNEEDIKQGFLELCRERDKDNHSSCLGYNAVPDSVCNTIFWEIAEILFAPRTFADMLAILMPSIKEVITIDISLTANIKTKPLNQYTELLQVRLVATPVTSFATPLPNQRDLNRYAFGNHAMLPVVEAENLHFSLHQQLYALLNNYPYLKNVVYDFNPEFFKLRGLIEIAQKASLKDRIDSVINIFMRSGTSATGEIYARDEARIASEQFIDYLDLFAKEDRVEIMAMSNKDRTISMQAVIDHLKKLNCTDTAAGWLKTIKDNPENRHSLEKVLNYNKIEFKAKTEIYGKQPLTSVGHDDTKTIPDSVRQLSLAQIKVDTFSTLFDLLLSLPAEELEFLLSHANIKKKLIYSKTMANNIYILGNEKEAAYLNAITRLASKFNISELEIFKFYHDSNKLGLFRNYIQTLPEAERIAKIDSIILSYIKSKLDLNRLPDIIMLSGDVNRVYSNNKTLLGMLLVSDRIDDIDAIRTLVENGANLNLPSKKRLPLEIVMRLLLRTGSNTSGEVLFRSLKYLLEQGADFNLLDKEQLIRDLAIPKKHAYPVQILNLFFQYGLEINSIKNIGVLLGNVIDSAQNHKNRDKGHYVQLIEVLINHLKEPTQLAEDSFIHSILRRPVYPHTLNILKLIHADLPEIASRAYLYIDNFQDEAFFRELVAYLPNLNYRFLNNDSVLGMVIKKNAPGNIMRALLSGGADPNQTIDTHVSAIAYLLSEPDAEKKSKTSEKVAILVELGATVSPQDKNRVTHCVVNARNLKAIQKLDLTDLDINQTLAEGKTLLDIALTNHDVPMVQHLVERRALHNSDLAQILLKTINDYSQPDLDFAKMLISTFKIDLASIDYSSLDHINVRKLWEVVASQAAYHPLPDKFYELLGFNLSSWYKPNETAKEAKVALFTWISQSQFSTDTLRYLLDSDNRRLLDDEDLKILVNSLDHFKCFLRYTLSEDKFTDSFKLLQPMLPEWIKNTNDLNELLCIIKMPANIKKLILNQMFDFQFPNVTPTDACAIYLVNIGKDCICTGNDARLIELIDLIIIKLKKQSKSNEDFHALLILFFRKVDWLYNMHSDMRSATSKLKGYIYKVLLTHMFEDLTLLPVIKTTFTLIPVIKTPFLVDSNDAHLVLYSNHSHSEDMREYQDRFVKNLEKFFEIFDTHCNELRKQTSFGFFSSDFTDKLKQIKNPIDKFIELMEHIMETRISRAAMVLDELSSGKKSTAQSGPRR